MFDFTTFGPLLLSTGTLLVLFWGLGPQVPIARIAASALCAGLAARYLWWRWTVSFPLDQEWWQQAWAGIFFVFEAGSIASSMLVYLFMSRHVDRSAQADARRGSPLLSAPVDVFIATYNESREVLERTMVGALSITHSDLRVWILDDGARDWLRDLAAELGVHYTRRVKGRHAKAGNVNAGLEVALSTGRPPEFVLLLDADFVPSRNILERTLGLFEEPNVGIVQTPQQFFNSDPIQSNLLCASVWPDEQRFFFNAFMPCKDAWGAAFCCGTSAVFRVAALRATNGMATETVTEDMLTTFKMEEVGYRTIYLNETLSRGLAPEGLQEYITQRSRWCLGNMQQIYTRWSFAGWSRIRLINRISHLDSTLYWGTTFPFRLMMISAPLVYWWTGTVVINSGFADLVQWLAPHIIGSLIYMSAVANNRVLPVMTDVSQLLSGFVVCRTVATALVKPWGHPFKVTGKGISSDRVVVQWRLMLPFVGLAAGTIGGVVVGTSPYGWSYGSSGHAVNVFWSLFNVLVLLLAAAVCVELPRRRRDERFGSGEMAVVGTPDGEEISCLVRDISLGGARLSGMDIMSFRGDGTLRLADGPSVPFSTIRNIGTDLAIRFPDETAVRRALIAHLFTGRYDNRVDEVSMTKVLRHAIGALFR